MRNKDQLTNANLREVTSATFGMLDATQDEDQGVVVAAAAAFFLLVCERLNVSPQDAFSATANIMNHAEGRRVEFQAIATFMKEEWATR